MVLPTDVITDDEEDEDAGEDSFAEKHVMMALLHQSMEALSDEEEEGDSKAEGGGMPPELVRAFRRASIAIAQPREPRKIPEEEASL